ncbi:iron-sulfur cluster assembly scaffold protein [Curtobacterium sp. MCJR17_043]|uniref:iron-sulfur cluster assembly scaffold protein n=1 Tax=Curtobacterium sp. MCJR17_043 TaxID=2175660 RepID=UPI0032E8DB83
MPDADAEHFERNPTCGDEITVRLRLEPGTDRIAAVAWQGGTAARSRWRRPRSSPTWPSAGPSRNS